MNMPVMLILVFLTAVLASVAVTPLVVRLAIKHGLYDHPTGGRRVHTRPIPRVGGVAVFLAMVIGLGIGLIGNSAASGLTAEQFRFFAGMFIGGVILFVTGLVDDLRELRPSAKLLAQVAAAGVVYLLGFRIEVISWGSSGLSLGLVSLPITILWVVGVTNAYNLIDGLDGVATGIAVVALGTMLTMALALGRLDMAVAATALLGALLGFLPFNFNPARIFLGDSGSLFVGFVLSVLSIHGATKSATAVLALVPLFALAIPLLDAVLAIARRWLRGVAVSSPDARHVHHRLLALGLTQRWVAVTMYVAATTLAGIGLVIGLAPPAFVVQAAVAGGVLSLVMLIYAVRRLDYHELMTAGNVLATAPRRARRVIQDRIYAGDLARAIETASSVDEIQVALETSASTFGFLQLELCGGWSAVSDRFAREDGTPRRVWKLYYPVAVPASPSGDELYLRIWCDSELSSRPYGAERVAHILAPALERWFAAVEVAALTRAPEAVAVARELPSRPMAASVQV